MIYENANDSSYTPCHHYLCTPHFCLHSGNVCTHKKGIQLCVDIVLNFLNTLYQSNSFTSIHLFSLLYFVLITASPVICGQSKMSYNRKSYCSLFSELNPSIQEKHVWAQYMVEEKESDFSSVWHKKQAKKKMVGNGALYTHLADQCSYGQNSWHNKYR